MYDICMYGENEKLKFICQISLAFNGIVASNIAKMNNRNVPDVNCEHTDRVRIIKELTLCREGSMSVSGLTVQETEDLIREISTY
jgi:hypothetical protein